jgi:hypothetical protein
MFSFFKSWTWVGRVAQVVEHLPSKCKVKPQYHKKKKKKKKKEEEEEERRRRRKKYEEEEESN